jgi:hypothetical protein
VIFLWNHSEVNFIVYSYVKIVSIAENVISEIKRFKI